MTDAQGDEGDFLFVVEDGKLECTKPIEGEVKVPPSLPFVEIRAWAGSVTAGMIAAAGIDSARELRPRRTLGSGKEENKRAFFV